MEDKFEIWAIVELFGHQQIAGRVSEQTVGGATFIRVDVPKTAVQESYTRMPNPSAIYAINPVTEEVATYRAEQIKAKPIEAWDFRQMLTKTLELEGKRIVAGTPDPDEFEDM